MLVVVKSAEALYTPVSLDDSRKEVMDLMALKLKPNPKSMPKR